MTRQQRLLTDAKHFKILNPRCVGMKVQLQHCYYIQSLRCRSNKRMTDWSQEEESVFMDLVQKYTRDNIIEGTRQIDNFREVMMSRHLVWDISSFNLPETNYTHVTCETLLYTNAFSNTIKYGYHP